MAFIGSVPAWEHHFQARDADVDHDVKLLQLETKDTEIDSKIGHQGKNITTVLGYSYTANVYSDENISIIWTSQTIRFRHKMSSSRYVTRTFWSPSYTQTTNSYLNPGTDYYPNLQTYDDSSFHATSYGQFAMVIQDRDYDQFAYKIEAYYDYYYTKIVVTRLK